MCGEFLELAHDVDRLLSTSATHLLGRWLAKAKARGTTAAVDALYEFNARNQGGGTELLQNKEKEGREGARQRGVFELWSEFTGLGLKDPP